MLFGQARMPFLRLLGPGFAAAAIATSALALECPLPQTAGKPGVIEEPQATIAAMAPALSRPDVARRAPELIAQVRARHPAAQSDEIVNFLLTAYCPVAVAQGRDEAARRALIEAFTSAVMEALY